jgi:hypothetical protein
MQEVPPAGLSLCKHQTAGKGSSLLFNGTNNGRIPHSSYYESDEFSISFFFYLSEDSTGDWRTVFHKGSSSQEMTPSVFLWPKERRLHVRASTQFSWNEGLDSTAVIKLRRWTHLAVVGSGQLLQLFVNGILDSQVILKAPIKYNRGEIYLGKDPWHSGFKGFLDDLRIFNKPLHEEDFRPIAAPTTPLPAVSGVMLGCQLCNYDDALASCRDDYHLCSLEELYSGPFEMARAMGWFRFTADVWTRNTDDQTTTTADEMQDPDLFKLGMCCWDY